MARKGIGIQKLPRSLNFDEEALRQGRAEDIPSYYTAHDFTHGTYEALKYRVTHAVDESTSTFYLDQAHNPELLEAAANFAGPSALLGYRSACRFLRSPSRAPYLDCSN